METLAIVLEEPGNISLREVALTPPQAGDVVVDVHWSGISTGTEKLLWSGDMPPFPGLAYPLIPGYESVGTVAQAGPDTAFSEGDLVFVPGANCYQNVRGLFGGAVQRLVSDATRLQKLNPALGDQGVLLALAATAFHALHPAPGHHPALPDLIIGHGVLGRLMARLTVALGGEPPMVWEQDPSRQSGLQGYAVSTADQDDHRAYARILDVSGDSDLLDTMISRLAPGGEVVLAGFYKGRPNFAFPPAFMREARFRIAAEWKPDDLKAVHALIDDGRLSLDGLLTHRASATNAPEAYETAFKNPSCLKMVLAWDDKKAGEDRT